MLEVSPTLSRRSLSERGLGFVLLAPAALLLLLIVVYPIAALVWNSFFDIHLAEPWRGEPFVGIENYRRAFEDARFWSSLGNTIVYTVVTVPGALLVGLGLALLANLPFRHKWPVRLGLLLPWALPLVFSGLIFRWFFEYRQGIVNDVLVRFGAEPLAWLTEPHLAIAAICIVFNSFVSLESAILLILGPASAIPAAKPARKPMFSMNSPVSPMC